MKVFTFTADDADSPVKVYARIWCATVGRGGAPVMDWHPVLIPGPSAEAARAKAETWWSAQVEAERAKDTAHEARRVALAAGRKTVVATPPGNSAEAI